MALNFMRMANSGRPNRIEERARKTKTGDHPQCRRLLERQNLLAGIVDNERDPLHRKLDDLMLELLLSDSRVDEIQPIRGRRQLDARITGSGSSIFSYNHDSRHIVDENLQFPGGQNALLSLANGGGKSVLVQLILPGHCPQRQDQAVTSPASSPAKNSVLRND